MKKSVSPSTKSFVGKLAVLFLGLVFMFGAVAPDAHAWWENKWQQRKKVQFETSTKGADIKDNLTDMPVLVRLHTGNFSFSNAKSDGSDLRFVSSDDKTPLKHHIEKFDPKEEIALIWVKVPRISGGGQDFIWMYYGNSSASDGQDAGGTYDVNQVAVFHLAEKTGNPQDATAYKNHAASFTGKLGLPSVIGSGAQFGGAGDKMTIAKSPSLNFSKGFTFSTWVRPNQPSGQSLLFSWNDGSQSIVIGIDEAARPYCALASGRGQAVTTPKASALTAKTWNHLAVTVEPGKEMTVYLNGAYASSIKIANTVPAPSAEMIIGASAKGDNMFVDLDEVQLSNIARPAGWMKAAFQGQGPEGTLTTYLDEENGGGSNDALTIHLMKVIIRTITLDGWLIIGILFIMGCWSVVIFQQKLTMFRLAEKANKGFSVTFREQDDPLALQGKDQEFQHSPLYRVYHAGCQELTQWLKRSKEKFEYGSGLSDRAMNGFKAAVEKEAMYESRKLSAGLIIMHMSIAGGPFLGLLGTVWGVMNTFAGLAESGEANLSAIAPGVASALACTMAGLLVAIPALFANSYLTGKIRDLNADVNLFIDDFILKLEEEKGMHHEK
jgi:biopolymer transport protein ExbB